MLIRMCKGVNKKMLFILHRVLNNIFPRINTPDDDDKENIII